MTAITKMVKPGFTNIILITLVTILVIVTGSAFFVNNTLQSIVKDISEETKPDKRLILLKGLMLNISKAENSVKSYGITRDENYLDTYNATIRSLNGDILQLNQAAEADTFFIGQIDRIDTLLSQKFIVLDELIFIQNQQRVNIIIDKVRNKVDDISQLSTQRINSEIDKSEKERFFKRVFGNRAKEKERVNNQNKQYNSFLRIDSELNRIEKTEVQREIELKTQELSLIQRDKQIMDEVQEIVVKIEEKERQNIEAKLIESDEQGKFTSWIIIFFCVLSCLLLIIAGYTVYTYVTKNNAYKSALISAKEETETKNKEVHSSIVYAKRLQNSILPNPEKIATLFPKSFIIYKPKDIVAGDFYWMKRIENFTFIAVADCTGHGVPGAMVSMACSSALNRAVKEFGLREPALILDKCREIIIETFDENEVYDGMDIALCRIDKTNHKLQYAGANNSLLKINKGELSEIKPNKQPVARYQIMAPFTNHEINIKEGDTFYLFSDGFADQFGGDRGKKYMYGHFKILLSKNAHLDLYVQQQGLIKTLENWQGNYDQVDDICLIGFRV